MEIMTTIVTMNVRNVIIPTQSCIIRLIDSNIVIGITSIIGKWPTARPAYAITSIILTQTEHTFEYLEKIIVKK
ncbi:hypothetical protein KHA96_09930 [Bacillus sp. FJAT-49711]|uniref:hypothetical protein n=1 Tax=Bacillus sp. FJAT-49711 TaxID=2833585 RepID=UPI001BC8FE9B|nr:hypothetical protein [Bacillus sp. FJAT-49711]MBS4218630.1 hypothetical protein [Bacillus sp. FJAT-49711]